MSFNRDYPDIYLSIELQAKAVLDLFRKKICS